jgi:hypothetical protein
VIAVVSVVYSWPVVGCGQDPDYDAQLGVFDLNHNPDDYLDLSVQKTRWDDEWQQQSHSMHPGK